RPNRPKGCPCSVERKARLEPELRPGRLALFNVTPCRLQRLSPQGTGCEFKSEGCQCLKRRKATRRLPCKIKQGQPKRLSLFRGAENET
ncbi:MAG: hypothetical protein WCS67_09320, partial [Bacteroidales bacterium]